MNRWRIFTEDAKWVGAYLHFGAVRLEIDHADDPADWADVELSKEEARQIGQALINLAESLNGDAEE